MPKSSKFGGQGVRGQSKLAVRVILGGLIAANLAAAGFLLFPAGGSADELEQQLAVLQSQAQTRRAKLESTRAHLAAVEKGRAEGDRFLSGYFLSRRTAYATLVSELNAAADQARIKPREQAYSTEPVEGSDSLSMMTITASYEGTYSDLMRFIHEVDRSPRLLIIESLNAAPQQGSNSLAINMKLETFVREDGALPQ